MWVCKLFTTVGGADSPHTTSTSRSVLTTSPSCRASAASTAFRRNPFPGRDRPSSATSTGPSSRTCTTTPVCTVKRPPSEHGSQAATVQPGQEIPPPAGAWPLACRRVPPSIGTQIIQYACAAERPLRPADSPPVADHRDVQVVPDVGGHHRLEQPVRPVRGGPGGQPPQPRGHPVDVGVHRERGP